MTTREQMITYFREKKTDHKNEQYYIDVTENDDFIADATGIPER